MTMKRLLAIIALFAAGNALAATCWMDTINRRVNWFSRPDSVTIDGVTYSSYITDDMLAAGGWVEVTYDECAASDRAWGWDPQAWARPMTQSELEARDAEKAAEQTAASQYADVQPANYAPRVSGSLTNKVGDSQLFVDDDTGEVFAVDETGSPEHTVEQKQAQRAARKAKRAAAAAAIESAGKNGRVNDRLDAIEAALKEMLK